MITIPDYLEQILKNQEVIMRALFRNFNNSELDNVNDDLRREWNNTISLLNPTEEQIIAEKPEEFFGESAKQGESVK